jgi:hypothetical protein
MYNQRSAASKHEQSKPASREQKQVDTYLVEIANVTADACGLPPLILELPCSCPTAILNYVKALHTTHTYS